MTTPAVLALQDGTVFHGTSVGAEGQTIGADGSAVEDGAVLEGETCGGGQEANLINQSL